MGMSRDVTDHKGRNVEVGLLRLLQAVPVQPSIVGLELDSAVVAMMRGQVWPMEGT
jgi:hypothetical protein